MDLTPEGLLLSQQDLAGKIERTMSNLKKSMAQSKITAGTVQTRINLLEKYWSDFSENNRVIMYKRCDEFRTSDYVTKRLADPVEELYVQQRSALHDLALKYCSSDKSSGSSGSCTEEHSQGTAPLPRLQLPEFDGAYVDWPAFKDLFKSVVERNKRLSDVDRLQYLKTSLSGEAADLVKNLPTIGENYERAWNILKEQYENKRILVRACLDKLSSIPRMRESSAREIIHVQKEVATVVNTLEGLGRPIDKTEDWFVYSVGRLFDQGTKNKWEEALAGTSEPPTFTALKEFLTKRRHQLEASLEPNPTKPAQGSCRHPSRNFEARPSQGPRKAKESNQSVRANHVQQAQKPSCAMCKREHYLMQCPDYKALPPAERRGYAQKHGHCDNCLGRHSAATCPSTKGCSSCGERHHSLLHDAYRDDPKTTRTVHHTLNCQQVKGEVLLATALIKVSDHHGRRQEVRALIDQGSEVSMVGEGLAQRLQLPRAATSVDIFGVGGQQLARARGKVTLDICGKHEDTAIKVSAIVLPKLTAYTRGCTVPRRSWNHLRGLHLADPGTAGTKPIEVLLGADVYPAIIKEGVKKGQTNEPVGQLTLFGWIVTGIAGSTADSSHARVHQALVGDSLSSLVRKFWEQEDFGDTHSTLTAEEVECEKHFVTTHSRTPEGRYMVRLPFRTPNPATSGSRSAAWHSLRRMEQRFKRDEQFRSLYCSFVREYEDLKHMSLVREPAPEDLAHYLPHHGVLKPGSTTTKLRVVFNGSWSEPDQPSLNDCLYPGPNLLPLLADVLMRWRKHIFVVTADVTKMYRQILVHPEDRTHQRILWRANESQQVREYQLNTVTYGLSCAPFLAVRTLHQLAEDEGSQYPIGAQALRHSSYVDDILTGADNIPALRDAANQLHQLCKAGGFPLQKWASNVADLHDVTPESPQGTVTQPPPQQAPKTWTDSLHSTLGLQWSPQEDSFRFSTVSGLSQPSTKRGVVSGAAQLFDPLGWLTPTIVRAKIIIQSTWLLTLGWDDPLPPPLAKEWAEYCAELKLIEQVRVPRPLFSSTHHEAREFHGFADASERAYGAVIYVRTRDLEGRWKVSLIMAKSKVAPLQQVSLPRLELCAAHLLARVTQHTVTALNLTDTSIHLWSDSTVALGWIQAHPSRWKTYVANRVADIQRRVPEAQWHHVAGVDNPADCASRGLAPSQLINWDLWWNGPEFLHCDNRFAPPEPADFERLPEVRGHISATVTKREKEAEENPIVLRFSSYTRLLRITAWCRRWLRKRNTASRPSLADSQQLVLSVDEIVAAERGLIRRAQQTTFATEKATIKMGQCVSKGSSLTSLSPMLDHNGLMRVGGRLSNSLLNPDEAHPIILPPKSRLTLLIIACAHRRNLHAGVQATLGAVRQQFWVPRGRAVVKAAINKCVTCARWRADSASQLMGQLPAHRVTPARPFHATGVDYAGPIWLRTTAGRGHKAYKGFLAVFVCMVTKAVHLEVVSDYSSEAFLAAFRRFISRRGICAHVHSDCGTTFTGADRELRRLFTASSQENRTIRSQLRDLKTQWHFNPPGAPHFGGLWEAAVKSTKHHLRRTIGETRLTFEEMTTLLTQVEACLNSRPLAALSDDPADIMALTPGHFLIGSALNSLPEPSLDDVATNRLSRWQLLTKMRDEFWTRWRREYLQGLTTRARWRQTKEDLAVGRLCVIVGENTPPSQWPLARVKEVHPGRDGKVRVATLSTASGEFLRPVHKLVVLPIEEDNQ